MKKKTNRFMTDFEIWQSFRQSGMTKKQVEVLSELNLMPQKEIIKIINKMEKQRAASDREYRSLLKKARSNTPSQACRGRVSEILS